MRFLYLVFILLPLLSYGSESKRRALLASELDFRLPSLGESAARGPLDYLAKRYLIVLGLSSDCTTIDQLAKRLGELAKLPLPAESALVVVDTNLRPALTELEKQQRSSATAWPRYLLDATQGLAWRYGLTNENPVVWLDLEHATLSPGPPSPASEAIRSWAKSLEQCRALVTPPNYADARADFVRPFSRSCQACHLASAATDQFPDPASLERWLPMIRKTMLTARMPGGFLTDRHFTPETRFGNEELRRIFFAPKEFLRTKEFAREFAENRRYLQKFLRDKGARPANSLGRYTVTRRPAPREAQAYYQYTILAENIPAPLSLAAVDFKGDPANLHHTLLYAFAPGTKLPRYFREASQGEFMETELYANFWASKAASGKAGGRPLKIAVGTEPIVLTIGRRDGVYRFDDDTRYLIPKGSTLALGLHWQLAPQAKLADVAVELFGESTLPAGAKELKRLSINVADGFELLPGQSDYVVESRLTLERAMHLRYFDFHGHTRLRSASLAYRTEEGDEKTFVVLPSYNVLTDQRYFLPREGLKLPRASTLITRMHYDNSWSNPAVADPQKKVQLGGHSENDEMHVIKLYYTEDAP